MENPNGGHLVHQVPKLRPCAHNGYCDRDKQQRNRGFRLRVAEVAYVE